MNKMKATAAVIGSGAVVALGIFSSGVHQEPAGGTTVGLGRTTMTTGVTIISQTPPPTSLTTRAEPQIKGPAPLPPEQEAAK